MRIDSLSATPDRAGRYRLSLSDGTSLRLYRQTVEDFGLYAGLELPESELERLRTAAGEMSAKMRAVRIVAATNVSSQDLQQRLVRKGEDPIQAQEAVEWMQELDLVDDAKTAALLVSRCIQKGYGLSRARQVLYEKRVPRDLWEETLANYPDQTEKIQAFLDSRLTGQSNPREVRRAIDALLRRGHSYGDIRRCLDAMDLETEED